MKFSFNHLAVCSLLMLCVSAELNAFAADGTDPVFNKERLGKRVAQSSTIILCSDLENVTPDLIKAFASKIYPDGRYFDVVDGLDTRQHSGQTVYAYAGGKIPSAKLRDCAEGSYPPGGRDKIASSIVESHTRLGQDFTSTLLPKDHPLKNRLSGAQVAASYVYGDDWVSLVFVSLKDENFARRQFLQALFGLTYEFCEKKCEELLADR